MDRDRLGYFVKGGKPYNYIGLKKDCLNCGKEFKVKPSRITPTSGKFCSQLCRSKFSGIKTACLICKTPFKYSPSMKRKYCSLKCSAIASKDKTQWNKGLKMPNFTKENNPSWRGNNVTYKGLHSWININKQKPNPDKCEFCNKTNNLEWANKSQLYKRDLSDWLRLCSKCHGEYDKENKNSKRKFHI